MKILIGNIFIYQIEFQSFNEILVGFWANKAIWSCHSICWQNRKRLNFHDQLSRYWSRSWFHFPSIFNFPYYDRYLIRFSIESLTLFIYAFKCLEMKNPFGILFSLTSLCVNCAIDSFINIIYHGSFKWRIKIN